MMEHPELTIMVQELRRNDAIRTAAERRVGERPGFILFAARIVNALRTRRTERKTRRESVAAEPVQKPASIARTEPS